MNRQSLTGLAVVMFFGFGTAIAQTTPLSPFQAAPDAITGPSGSAGFPVGPMTVIPGIQFAQGYDDNLHLTPNRRDTSAFTSVSPRLHAEMKSGANRYDATLRVDHRSYWGSPNDNYTNYSAVGNADLIFDGRTGLKLTGEFRHASDPIGYTDRPITKTPDQYNNYGVAGVFRYGAQGAQGRIEIDGGAFARRYTNHHETTDASNRNTWRAGGTFYWRVMPRTEVLVQARHTRYNYTDDSDPGPTQSSGENRYYVGVKWEATAATTGILKLGYLTKNFDSSTIKDYSTFSWEGGIRWSPRTYSIFDLTTAKFTQEATGVGSAIVTSRYGLVWNHAWNSRVRTQALANYQKDDFLDASPPRLDKTYNLGGRINYDFRRWLILGAEYLYTDRNSSLGVYDYKRNLFQITVGATM